MAFVIVDRWYSKCSACGGNADPNENQHNRGGPKNTPLDEFRGCAVEWDRRECSYFPVDEHLNWTDMESPLYVW